MTHHTQYDIFYQWNIYIKMLWKQNDWKESKMIFRYIELIWSMVWHFHILITKIDYLPLKMMAVCSRWNDIGELSVANESFE